MKKMAAEKTGIFIVYSERLFCDGVRSMLAREDEYFISGTVENNDTVLNEISSCHPDIIILEVEQANTITIALIDSIRALFTSIPVFLIASVLKKGLTENIIDSGIAGFIFKSGSKDELLKALSKLRTNDRYFCLEISHLLLKDFQELNDDESDLLTYRERQILELLIDGETNHNIAGLLRISENTVKSHRRNIMEKFGAKNLLGMVRYAYEKNLINRSQPAI